MQAHRKEPEGRLKMRLHRRGHCRPALTAKSWQLPSAGAYSVQFDDQNLTVGQAVHPALGLTLTRRA